VSKKFQKPAKLKLSKDMEEWTIDVAHQKTILKAGALQNAIFNSATFSCIATDAKGVIQIFNVGAERMLGYAATEVLNKVMARPRNLDPAKC